MIDRTNVAGKSRLAARFVQKERETFAGVESSETLPIRLGRREIRESGSESSRNRDLFAKIDVLNRIEELYTVFHRPLERFAS
jgi:hypothetical protein